MKGSWVDRIPPSIRRFLKWDGDGAKEGRLHRFAMFAGAVASRFQKDEATLRAASTSYSLIVSFIPTLVVALLIGARFIDIQDYYLAASEYVRRNQIPLDLKPYFNIINELLNNAAAIGGVGFLITLFSATSVLRNLEDSLNVIWNVRQQRPIVQRVAGYVLVLIFGPFLLITGVSAGETLVRSLSPPGFRTVRTMVQGAPVFGGERQTLLKQSSRGEWTSFPIVDRVDFAAQKDPVIFDSEMSRVLEGAEKARYLAKMDRVKRRDLQASTITDLTRLGMYWWAVTDDGAVLRSRDDGKVWDVQRFERADVSLLFHLRFHRILMLDEQKGILVGDSGTILVTNDAGETWHPRGIPGLRANLMDLALLPGGEILVVGSGFTALESRDGGETWSVQGALAAMAEGDRPDLNSVFASTDSIWISGDAATLLYSWDGGKSWKYRRIGLKTRDFNAVLFTNDRNGILIGDQGLIRVSNDWGISWRKASSPLDQNLVRMAMDPASGIVYIVADDYSILASPPGNHREFHLLVQSPFWKSLLSSVGEVLLPFSVIWLLFFLLYRMLPYTEVKFKSAATGAALTSLLWVSFMLGFKYYIKSFSSGTFAVYGTLAAIPLGLMMVYFSVVIILIGGEIAFFIQYPGLIETWANGPQETAAKPALWRGIRILKKIYGDFSSRKGGTRASDLADLCNRDEGEMERIVSLLVEAGYLVRTDRNLVLPGVSADRISLLDLMDLLEPHDRTIPEYDPEDPFLQDCRTLFDAERSRVEDLYGKVSLGSLLREQGDRTTV